MKMENGDLIISMALVQSRLLKRIDSHLSVHGLSFSDFIVMHHLEQAEAKTMRRIDLAEAVGLSASGVTRLLNPMVKMKLVEKQANPRDARVSLVKISSVGSRIYSEAALSFEIAADIFMKPLNSKKSQRLSKLMKALL